MAGDLSPDAALALMQAGQTNTGPTTKALKNAAKSREMDKIESTAQEFEAVFIAEMMKPMFEGISTEAPFGGGKGEEVFRGMLIQEYGKILSETGGIGISDSVKQQMIQLQGQIDNGGLPNE